MYKVIVAHPGQQHSYKVATALNKQGYLFKYITTVYDKKNSFLMGVVKKIVGKKDATRANNRKNSEIEENKVIQFCELEGLLLLLILRLDKTKSRCLYNSYNRFVANKFGKKVARYAIKNKVDAVICYDSNSMSCFNILKQKAPHILRIMDNAAPNRYGLYLEYQENNRKYHVIDKQQDAFKAYLVNEKKALYFKNEALLADKHIVASSFSKRMLTTVGIQEDNIEIIPYGFNQSEEKINHKENSKIKFLFVGEISAQKGIFNYIDVAKKYNDIAEFHAVGGGINNLASEYREQINDCIIYHGYMLQKELFDLYKEMDVFVFPSLGDGFGFVVLEALNFGIPVICSRNSVGEDAISDGINGFLVDAGNAEQLAERVFWFIEHSDQINDMRINAIKSVEAYSWDQYYVDMSNTVEKLLETRYVIK